MEGKCFFCLFLVFHGASERGREELGTVRLLCFGGGEGIQKSVVCQNFTPSSQKRCYIWKLYSPLGNSNF